MTGIEWKDLERAEAWSSFRSRLPHAADAEALLVEHLLPSQIGRILDLGTGNGHLIALLKPQLSASSAVGLDLSPAMVEAARERFAAAEGVEFDVHDLMEPLPDTLGQFDLVVSGLAIHHLPDHRKRGLFGEIFELLTDGGVFYDLDCVTSSTLEMHSLSQKALGLEVREQDPSDQPARLDQQLSWLREAGFGQVDCYWKWLELAMVGGSKLG